MILKVIYVAMGVGSLANGLFMFFAPVTWFERGVPGVEDTGPMNIHFIRDVGVVYAIVGVGLLWAAFHLARARIVHIGVTLFLFGHALEHMMEIFIGDLPRSHWYLDAAGVFLPGILFLILALPPVWNRLNPAADTAPSTGMT